MKKENEMTTSDTYIEIEDDNKELVEDFNRAFTTKVGTEYRRSLSHKFKDQYPYCLHQIYHPDTWFVDLVKFDDYWYVFFVEANTRYLIVVQGNSNFIIENAVEINANKRVPSNIFLEAFQQFQSMINKPIYKLIGDSEKAFWSQAMMDYYRKNNILTKIINVSQEGHIGMAILDRLVRTIRSAANNLYPQNEGKISPTEMIKVVVIYNTSAHSTFTRMKLGKLTPTDLHNSRDLENSFRQALVKDKERILAMKNFIIKPGTEIVVRDEMKMTQRGLKKTKTPMIIPGKWEVVAYIPNHGYTIKNNEGEILTNIQRRNLRPIHHY